MANLLIDMAAYFVVRGLATGDGVDVFRDYTPDTPDDVIALYEYAGMPMGRPSEAVNRNVQIRVRDKSTSQARSRINAIYDLMCNPYETVLNLPNGRWMIGTPKQTPYKLMEDTNRRAIYVFNYGVLTYTD